MKDTILGAARSKVIWFNAIVAGLAALEAVWSVLSAVVPGNTYAWLTVILTVGNAILRTVTTQALGQK
jgi:hypothetical protein